MKNSFTVAIIAAIASLFNFAVGAGDLRISLGIVVLIVALHASKELNIMSTAFITGLAVFLTRVLMSVLLTASIDTPLIISYFIEIIFYLAYAVIYKALVLNEKNEAGTPILLLFILSDFGANTVEYLVRHIFYSDGLMQADFVSIFLAAFIRSALIWLILKYVFDQKDLRAAV